MKKDRKIERQKYEIKNVGRQKDRNMKERQNYEIQKGRKIERQKYERNIERQEDRKREI